MAQINFIFKNTQYRKGLGGTMPPDTHIKSSKGYYYLGETADTNFQDILQWEPMPVSQQVVDGFNLLNVTQVSVNPDDPEDETMRDLNSTELENKHAAEKALKKIETRSQIHGQVGDIYDLVSDLSKRLGLLERITARTIDFIYNDSSISSEIPQAFKDGYGVLLNDYLSYIDGGTLRDRVDIEDNTELFTKLVDRNNTITNIVEDYLNY